MLIINVGMKVKFTLTLTNVTLAKGHSSKTKSHVSDIRTIGSLVHVLNRIRHFKRSYSI